jgi:hypothetical protein
MRSIDGEDAWKTFYNSLEPGTRFRYHRLNVQFSGPEPSLDDTTKLQELKDNVSDTIEANSDQITSVVDAMIASMFFLELDKKPSLDGTYYTCEGYIFCRVDLPPEGLRYLYHRMVETSSWFLIQGKPIKCVGTIPYTLPPFKRHVSFRVDSMDELLSISIRGITKGTRVLSGFPTTLRKLIDKQGLNNVFGDINHSVHEKALPAIPSKRTREESLSQIEEVGVKRIRNK